MIAEINYWSWSRSWKKDVPIIFWKLLGKCRDPSRPNNTQLDQLTLMSQLSNIFSKFSYHWHWFTSIGQVSYALAGVHTLPVLVGVVAILMVITIIIFNITTICLFVCLYGVFTLHGTSGYSATGPTALRDFRTTSRVNFYHQKHTSLTPQWNGRESNSCHRDGKRTPNWPRHWRVITPIWKITTITIITLIINFITINPFSSSPLFINLAEKRQAFFPGPQKFFLESL